LLQRLGISADILVETANAPQATPTVQLNPVSPSVEAQKVARKQDPETIKSEAVRKEIEEVGNINIEPMVVSTNENPEWVNFAANESGETQGTDGIIKITHASSETTPLENLSADASAHGQSELELEQPPHHESTEIPAWDEIVSESQGDAQKQLDADTSDLLDDTSKSKESANSSQPIVVHHVPETMVAETSDNTVNQPQETILYNQSEPGLDTLEPPPAPFAPIAGRVQETSSSPGWIGIAASLAAIVAAYFIWVAIQPATDESKQVVLSPEPVVEKPMAVATPKDTVPAGVRLVENYILDEKLEKYKEPNVFSVHQLDDLPERSKKALNDLEHHNIAVFDMEDVMFEELDLLIQ
jgi:hypothetical protein